MCWSADFRNVSAASAAILLNKELIAVSQDTLGRQGRRVAPPPTPPPPPAPVSWTRTSNGKCWDDECTNLGMPGCPDLTCCEAACLKDPRCNAMNIGGLKGQAISSCILRGCSAGEPNT